jgi:hypothetical protein
MTGNSITRRAVAYLRVASTQQDDAGIAIQRDACRRIAMQRDMAVIREYADIGRPARLEQQPELHRLLAELSQLRDAAAVIVWDYTRLSRNLTQLDTLIQRIRLCGAEVIALTGVKAAERLALYGSLLSEPSGTAAVPAHLPTYPLSLLRAAHQGLGIRQNLVVTALLPDGETVHGSVTGIGSRLGVRTADGRLVEDIRAEWVVYCDLVVSKP